MYERADTKKKNNRQSVANAVAQKQSGGAAAFSYIDNRPQAIAQRKENQTGLPENLKNGMENISGQSLDHVRVHYNSAKPAAVQAHAYAQGADIHLAPGQNQYLPHELGHVVQQAQGRVKPTTNVAGMQVNDNPSLESEATVMGQQALQMVGKTPENKSRTGAGELLKGAGFEGNKTSQLYGNSGDVGSKDVVQRGRVAEEKTERERVMGAADDRVVLKINMPGSGDDYWRTRSAPKTGTRMDSETSEDTPTMWGAATANKITWTVAGPGGASTKGSGSYSGKFDKGSNRIENNKKQVGMQALMQAAIYQTDRPLLILIKAHSRNAVAATQMASHLRQNVGTDRDVKIELVAFDPVPGPDHDGDDVETTISPALESTLIYSVASQYDTGHGFTPQKVFGARRIIISRQDHGGGLINGYLYQGRVYKGSSLNSLPRGVFIDSNKTSENTHELMKIDDCDNAVRLMEEQYKESESTTGDYGRLDIIKDVLSYYYKHNGPPPSSAPVAHTPSERSKDD